MKTTSRTSTSDAGSDNKNQVQELPSEQKVTAVACIVGAVAAIGGFIFGYAIGEISGFFLMPDFGNRFGEVQEDGSIEWSASRQGAMTGLMCIGALFGSLVAGRMADMIGRRMSISVTAFFTCLGTVIEISSSSHWAQYTVGRFVTGLSVGSLSVCVPLYQSESVPAVIRGVVVSSYQLMITLGIWAAEMVNWGTVKVSGSASWRIPTGLMFAWALVLGVAILFLPESPRYAYAKGDTIKARETIASLCGLPTDHREVNEQIDAIEAKCQEERQAAAFKFSEIWTGPRMAYRTVLGVVLGCGQQLTGANFFFYFGTTIFQSTGIKNSYTVQLILGSVNVVSTIAALFIIDRFGRRIILLVGAAWMCMCFLIYAFIGQFKLDHENPMNTPAAGSTLITFSCLAIAAFAISWGPLVWAVNAEMYPSRYRSTCMSLATASNWFWNFMLSFFTRFIVDAIHYYYGLVFAGCTAALFFIIFFFVIESKDRPLEDIDIMYLEHVNPITSGSYQITPEIRARYTHTAEITEA